MRSGFSAAGEARRSATRAARSRGVRTLRRRRSSRYVRRGAARAAAAQPQALDLAAATRESASFAPRRGGAALGERVGHPFHVVAAMGHRRCGESGGCSRRYLGGVRGAGFSASLFRVAVRARAGGERRRVAAAAPRLAARDRGARRCRRRRRAERRSATAHHLKCRKWREELFAHGAVLVDPAPTLRRGTRHAWLQKLSPHSKHSDKGTRSCTCHARGGWH